jgi:hypothetical protein
MLVSRLSISHGNAIQFIKRSGDALPHIEALAIASIHKLVHADRCVNGGIGSIELPHQFGGAPDVQFELCLFKHGILQIFYLAAVA